MNKINFKNLPDETTPINASNLNTMQDNIEAEINKKLGNLIVVKVTANSADFSYTTAGATQYISDVISITQGIRVVFKEVPTNKNMQLLSILNNSSGGFLNAASVPLQYIYDRGTSNSTSDVGLKTLATTGGHIALDTCTSGTITLIYALI